MDPDWLRGDTDLVDMIWTLLQLDSISFPETLRQLDESCGVVLEDTSELFFSDVLL